MEIKYVSHSIANRFPDHIEVNRNLKSYPKLIEPIIEHERKHTDGTFTMHDFKLDFFSNNKINHLSLMKFMFRHPLSFLQLSPILYSKKKGFIIDINLLIMYLVMIAIFTSTIYFGVKYL